MRAVSRRKYNESRYIRQRSSLSVNENFPAAERIGNDGAKEHTNMKPKNTICLWFNKDAQEAARFYAATFPKQ